MGQRKAISKSLRFEVFKRDSFTCQYCGAKAPDVILQVDHVHPVAAGGDNELLNLTTSCVPCNAGKRDKTLDDNSTLVRQRDQLADLQERREQIDMMLEWKRGLAKNDDYAVTQLADYWAELVVPFTLTATGKRSLAKLLAKHPMDRVMDSMRVAALQYVEHDADGKPTSNSVGIAWEYVGRICTIKKGEAEKPWLRDLLYIRKIILNRFGDGNIDWAARAIERALVGGADPEELKRMARQAGRFSHWERDMDELLAELES